MPLGVRNVGLAALVVLSIAVPAIVQAAAPNRPAITYRDHVVEATTALERLSATIEGASSLPELRAQEGQLRAHARDFVQAAARLDKYEVEDDRLNRQRDGLARTGKLAGREVAAFVSALVKGDPVALSRSEAITRTRIAQFAAAARLDADS